MDRICNPPAGHDGSAYRCPPDANTETRTEECALVDALQPVCYNGACGCEKVKDAATTEPGDGTTQGSCDADKICQLDGTCIGTFVIISKMTISSGVKT